MAYKTEGTDGQIWRRLNQNAIADIENFSALQFFKVPFGVYNVWHDAWEIYLREKKLWFCHLPVISSLNLWVPLQIEIYN